MISLSAVGRVITDVRIKTTSNGGCLVDFLLSVGTRQRENVLPVKAFGKTAEIIRDKIKKGSIIAIQGSVQRSSWKDNQGQARYSTDVIANMVFGPLAYAPQEGQQRPQQNGGQQQMGMNQNHQAPQNSSSQSQTLGQAMDQNHAPAPNNSFAHDDIPF